MAEIVRVRAETPRNCTGVTGMPGVCKGLSEIPDAFTGLAERPPDCNRVAGDPTFGTE